MQGVSCISGQEGRKPVCELDKVRESGQIFSLFPSPRAPGEGLGLLNERERQEQQQLRKRERERNPVRIGEKWTPKVTSGTLKVFVDPTSKAALANTWRTWSYCRRLAALDASHRYI